MDDQGVSTVAKLARAGSFDVMEVKDPRTGNAAVIGRKNDGSGGQHFEDITGKLDAFLKAPLRRTGTAKVLTSGALIALVTRHKDSDSAIFATIEPAQIVGVIDYHMVQQEAGPAAFTNRARFGKHRVQYDFPLTPQYEAWTGQDGEPLKQREFAEFIEENIVDLVSPSPVEAAYEKLFHTKFGSPAELMTLSRGLAIRVDTVVKEAHTLQSGEAEIQFSEEHKPGVGGGKLIVPGLFVTSFPLFEGEEPTRVVWRLRYRLNGGSLMWVFSAYRLDDVIRAKVLQVVSAVAAGTGLPSYLGTPEA